MSFTKLSLSGLRLLTIELVPSTSWGNNLRSRLSTADWDRLRKEQYRIAGYVCETHAAAGAVQSTPSNATKSGSTTI